MRIVISDTSCLIDLRKVSLLDIFLRLPYEFLIPNTLFEEELLKFTASQKKSLIHGGLKVVDLPGKSVLRAQQVVKALPQLSVHDGFAYALAEEHPDCILLTGDGALRSLAQNNAIEVHGVLWVFDEIYRCELANGRTLAVALQVLSTDVSVRLPQREMTAYLKRYKNLK
jgi:predicted nucleic acid-binding protein